MLITPRDPRTLMRERFGCNLSDMAGGGVVRSKVLKLIAAACLAFALAAQPQSASAQSVGDGQQAKGNIAGTIGLGMLGAEVGLLLPPMFKLQNHWWAWALFPTIGAAGGTVAGVFAFDPGSPSPAVTVSILGAGFALAVPAIVGAVAWKSARNNSEQNVASTGGLIRLGRDESLVGVPALTVRPTYSAGEQLRHGVAQRSVIGMPVVSGRF